MRKKSALHLDSRYSTMIENAYFYSNPPETRPEANVRRPAMHEYIRKLLYKDLGKTTVERVLRQMRKLDWNNTEVLPRTVIACRGVRKTKKKSFGFGFYAPQLCRQALLRRVLAMGILSVCLSVRPSRPGTDSMPGEIETPGLHHIIA